MAISAKTINDLKARVKAECSRRALTTYTEAAYDYTTAPASGVIIKQEHRDKIATPLNAINSDVVTKPNGQIVIAEDDITALDAFTTVLEKRSKNDQSGSDCKGSCLGMCYSCTGTCAGGCSSCTGGCTGSCSGGCSGSCSGCGTYCSHSCTDTCANNCQGGCKNTCKGNCKGGCQGSCYLTGTTNG